MNDNIKLTISEFIDYCRNEKMFSEHTVSAYKHDLDLMYFNFKEKGIKNLDEVDYDLLNVFLAEQLENKNSIPLGLSEAFDAHIETITIGAS